jgi:hypothetical protein
MNTFYVDNGFDIRNSYKKNINPKRGLEIQRMNDEIEDNTLNYLRQLSKKNKLDENLNIDLSIPSPIKTKEPSIFLYLISLIFLNFFYFLKIF